MLKIRYLKKIAKNLQFWGLLAIPPLPPAAEGSSSYPRDVTHIYCYKTFEIYVNLAEAIKSQFRSAK